MSDKVALCLEEEACRNPRLVGLDGESIDSQGWLAVYSSGEAARTSIKNDSSIREAWVVSCDDVEPINLAATLKADRPELRVMLVSAERCGSLFSRAHTAQIDEVISHRLFLSLYGEHKHSENASAGELGGEHKHSENASASEPASEPAGGPEGEPAGEQGVLSVAEPPEFTARAGEGRTPGHARLPQKLPSPAVAQPAHKGFIMPVVSGSGGAGKSSVSLLAAHSSARRGLKTLLLDYDLQFGDIAYLSGEKNPLAVDEALLHPERIERELVASSVPAVLAAPARLEASEEVARELPQLLDLLAGRFDVIVANTGAAWADQHVALLEHSTAALFLIDQRMSSVRACHHALELCARCGIASGPFHFVLNRCAKGAPLSSADVSAALQGISVFELKEGGRDVEECLSGGEVEELISSGNDFAASIDYVMSQLLPAGAQEPEAKIQREGPQGFMRRRGRHSGKKRGRKS